MKPARGLRSSGSTARRERMRSRALERFGLEIGKAARQALIGKVQAGDVKFARKLTHSRTVVVAEYSGVEVTFIYCGRAKRIVTFLPAGVPETSTVARKQGSGVRDQERERYIP